MGVIINVVGANSNTDEYRAAIKMKEIIQKTVPQSVIGEIVLYVSANLIGQTVKDVDLFMIGNIQNYKVGLDFTNQEGEIVHDNVEIASFCTTIEIKSHGINGISRIGTDFYVSYGNDRHSVTEQSNGQKTSAMKFFQRALSFSPFITNLIWFTEVERKELSELLKVESKEMPANVLGRDFSFSDVMQLLVWQRSPRKSGRYYRFDSTNGNCSVSDLQRALDMFTRVKKTMGELTRKRIEQITQKSISTDLFIPKNGKMPICRGKAGTGKTVGLIQTAIKLVDEVYARVLILTYNKALVSDIRRLFALAELPDLFEEKCVHISTMHAYYYRLINQCLYEGKLVGADFIKDYEKYLDEIIDFIQSDSEAYDCIQEIIEKDCILNWQYVLVDEAQDWTDKEKELLTLMFKNDHIVVADGGRQFVRNVDVCDWSTVKNRENIKLKYCLRQKNNIIKFINHFFYEYSGDDNKIHSADKLSGGKIIVLADKEKFYDIQKQELFSLKEKGNIAYDMLYLVPSTLVDKGEYKKFTLKDDFEKNDIFIWDGTNEIEREKYTIESDEVRVIQYESARGLEAWTLCCVGFDTFIENKSNHYNGNINSLFLQSREEGLKKYLENWIMIPFTRAIDTLIICLDNKDSALGKILYNISNEYPDYVTWI